MRRGPGQRKRRWLARRRCDAVAIRGADLDRAGGPAETAEQTLASCRGLPARAWADRQRQPATDAGPQARREPDRPRLSALNGPGVSDPGNEGFESKGSHRSQCARTGQAALGGNHCSPGHDVAGEGVGARAVESRPMQNLPRDPTELRQRSRRIRSPKARRSAHPWNPESVLRELPSARRGLPGSGRHPRPTQ